MIEPNPSHLNNLYAITKAKRSNLQERSNNQENEPHAPTQEQTPGKRAAYNINERFIITSYFHAVLGGGFEP